MSDDWLALLGVAAALTLGVLSVGPVPELGFLLQCSGLGALAGTGMGLRRRYRDEPGRRTTIVAYGALAGAAAGGLLVLVGLIVPGLS
jgi:hypothetical protein